MNAKKLRKNSCPCESGSRRTKQSYSEIRQRLLRRHHFFSKKTEKVANPRNDTVFLKFSESKLKKLLACNIYNFFATGTQNKKNRNCWGNVA